MGEGYKDKLGMFVASLQRDLSDEKIDEEQFRFLVGLFLKKELNSMVKEEMERLIEQEHEMSKMTLLTYRRNRKLVHAP